MNDTQVRMFGDPLLESAYTVRVGPKARYGTTGLTATSTGAAGLRDIYATTDNTTTNNLTIEVDLVGNLPITSYYRKVGQAAWDGSKFTDVRPMSGVQANADQFNSFVFQSVLASGTPLTVRGLTSQTADVFRVEDVNQTAVVRVTTSQAVVSQLQVTGSLLAANGSSGSPGVTFQSDADTGLYSAGANQLGLAAGGLGMVQITSGGNIQFPLSSASSPLVFGSDTQLYRSGVQTLALGINTSLNVLGGGHKLLMAGNPIASSDLNDSTVLVRNTGATFSGQVSVPAGSASIPGLAFAADSHSGVFQSTSGNVNISCAGSEIVRHTPNGTQLMLNNGSSGGLTIGSDTNRVQLFAGTGHALSYGGAATLGVFAQDLEVRCSTGSGLILTRPDGTRMRLSLDNSNGILLTAQP